MEEAPDNGKESSHSAHANGMNYSLNVVVEYRVGERVTVLPKTIQIDRNSLNAKKIN